MANIGRVILCVEAIVFIIKVQYNLDTIVPLFLAPIAIVIVGRHVLSPQYLHPRGGGRPTEEGAILPAIFVT
jgi:hypothetical protein